MNIAILSGKGGTGKTTVSTNLSLALKANYIDCDVEEPNGFIFLKPKVKYIEKVMIEYPFIDDNKCTTCGECTKVCNFNALAKVNNDIMLFQKLCHGCGACEIVCKHDALSYKKREIGKVEVASRGETICKRGILNISEPMAVPIIRQLLSDLPKEMNIIDCPPGTSCNVVNSLRYVDFAVLVTEPTEFGLHDLKMAIEVVKMFNMPFGVIINKDNEKENIIKRYCMEENIKIIGLIPYSKYIAKQYSKGEILYSNIEYKGMFDKIVEELEGVLKWN